MFRFTILCQYTCILIFRTIIVVWFLSNSFTVSFSGFNSLTVLFKRTESHELSWSTAWNWQFYEQTLYLCSDYLIMRFPERRHWQDGYILFISFVESFTVLFGFLSSTYYIKWQEWVMKNSTRLVLNYFSFLINTQGKKERVR